MPGFPQIVFSSIRRRVHDTHLFKHMFPTVDSNATQYVVAACLLLTVHTLSSPEVARQSRIRPSVLNVWPPMDYGINLAAWRRNFLAIA